MKVIIIAGTRPEAVKVAPIVLEFKKHLEIETLLCNSGQHKEMIDNVFADFQLVPDFSLDVMCENQSLSSLTAKLFLSLDKVLVEQNPDWIVVQGDTTTVMVSAMCAFYRNIKIAHVEAGLRSFDKKAPFPEETNRQIVTRVADLHFAPTRNSYANLIREGIDPDYAFVTGNTVIDALLWSQKYLNNKIHDYLDSDVNKALELGKKIILVTGHRRENFGEGLREICKAIKTLANNYDDIVFVYPVHLNPNVKEPICQNLRNIKNVFLLPVQSYLSFQALMSISYLVLTDSGGVQEEASALGKPVLVMRDITERPEGLKTGCACLVGARSTSIIEGVSNLLENSELYSQMASAKNPYGHGHSAERIVEAIIKASEL